MQNVILSVSLQWQEEIYRSALVWDWLVFRIIRIFWMDMMLGIGAIMWNYPSIKLAANRPMFSDEE